MPYHYHWNSQYVDPPPRWIHSHFDQFCRHCRAPIKTGDRVLFFSGRRAHNVSCATCAAKFHPQQPQPVPQ